MVAILILLRHHKGLHRLCNWPSGRSASSSEGDYDTLHATRLGIYIAGSVWIGWHGFGLAHFWEYCLCRAAARYVGGPGPGPPGRQALRLGLRPRA